MIKKFFEFKQEELEPVKSFTLKDTLNTEIWTDFKIDIEIREELLKLANDYFDDLELDIDIQDIILTGSLANFNWSKYSDFDLHILLSFKKINEDSELVSRFLKTYAKLWSTQHDITLLGYDVEINCQDTEAVHTSTGQFSLKDNKWIVKPTKQDFEPDEELIKEKSEKIMSEIDDIIEDFEDDINYSELSKDIKRVWNKIKDGRRSGLEKDGEFSIENLVFKVLRRNNYIEKLIDIKQKSYDRQFK